MVADELIRQVTINSPERGLLMLRVRDEIRMTIDAYKTLYQSSVTFGVRKQLQAEQGMAEMEADIAGLTEAKQDLENQVLERQRWSKGWHNALLLAKCLKVLKTNVLCRWIWQR